jgi:hypothetical protein
LHFYKIALQFARFALHFGKIAALNVMKSTRFGFFAASFFCILGISQ